MQDSIKRIPKDSDILKKNINDMFLDSLYSDMSTNNIDNMALGSIYHAGGCYLPTNNILEITQESTYDAPEDWDNSANNIQDMPQESIYDELEGCSVTMNNIQDEYNDSIYYVSRDCDMYSESVVTASQTLSINSKVLGASNQYI